MKNIKSYFIIKTLFVYVEEIRKWKIIKYNKRLQRNININIINYKFYSEKYIIYESKGIWKEYNGSNDKKLYEGDV